MNGPASEPAPPVCVTRRRAGLATNSSSSHSLIHRAESETVEDQPPSPDGNPDRFNYATDWVAASNLEKRHVLAGLLMAQAWRLWHLQLTDLDELDAALARTLGVNVGGRAEDDPTSGEYFPRRGMPIPEHVKREIVALAGLPAGTDVTLHRTTSSMAGDDVVLPVDVHGNGPDPVAWKALFELVLDPLTVLLCADENSTHPLQLSHPYSRGLRPVTEEDRAWHNRQFIGEEESWNDTEPS